MKKLIAISVVFALVLGAAFAQPSLGGNFKVGTPLLSGQSENEVDNKSVYAGGTTIDSAGVNVNFGDADAGGKLVLFHNPNESVPGYQPLFAFVWWRPIPQVRLQMGRNADGDWGFAQIAGWGYDAEAKSVGVAISQYNDQPNLSKLAADNKAWGPGFNGLGLAVSVFPIDGLEIDFAIPYASGDRAAKIYHNIYLGGSFALEDIGTIRLAAQFRDGNTNRYVANDKQVSGEEKPDNSWRGTAEAHDPASLWFAFHLTAIEGLGVELGVGYTLPYTTQDVKYVADSKVENLMHNVGGVGYKGLPVNTKVNTPVDIGLGAQFNSGDLGVKARAAFRLGGSTKVDLTKNKGYDKEYDKRLEDLKDVSHIPTDALYLGSDVFYEKRTIKRTDPSYVGSGTTPVIDYTYWQGRAGYQEKKADPFQWSLNVAPSYKIGNMTVILNMGIGMKHYLKQEVTVVKQELYTWVDGSGRERSEYRDVREKKFDGIDMYDPDSPLVYETITFEGKPGLYTKERNIDIPSKYVGKDINGKDVYLQDYEATSALHNDLKTIKADIDWFVNPYVSIPAGGGQFYVGFKLYADGSRIPVKYNRSAQNVTGALKGTSAGGGVESPVYDYSDPTDPKPTPLMSTRYQIKWAIPIGWNFYF